MRSKHLSKAGVADASSRNSSGRSPALDRRAASASARGGGGGAAGAGVGGGGGRPLPAVDDPPRPASFAEYGRRGVLQVYIVEAQAGQLGPAGARIAEEA